MAVFVVDLDGPGVTRLPGFDALGMRGSASGRLRLDGAVVPADRVLARRRTGQPDPRGAVPPGLVRVRHRRRLPRDRRGCPARGRPLGGRPPAGDGSSAVADVPTVQVRLGRLDAALRAARIVVLDVASRWEAATRPTAAA